MWKMQGSEGWYMRNAWTSLGICMFEKWVGLGKDVWKKCHLNWDLKDEERLTNEKIGSMLQAKRIVCEGKRDCAHSESELFHKDGMKDTNAGGIIREEAGFLSKPRYV